MNQISPFSTDRPIVFAGPCMAESYELLEAVVAPLVKLSTELKFDLVFKSSFDKANRTSIEGYRGPGLETAKKWFADLKVKHQVKIITDIHETTQAGPLGEVVDVLQIPAFLCRQTDLIVSAVGTGKWVNVKKGQFLAPHSARNIVEKCRDASAKKSLPQRVMLTERGASFGYGNLVVDPRSFPIMAEFGVPVIFDITHSTQLPGGSADGKSTAGERFFAPSLARAATATGYLSGYFLETHTQPAKALSDKAVQLSMTQSETLLRQLIPFWHQCRSLSQIDKMFLDV
jgi:2-dehydro-3-deoxyphosphooctonate aldolase (KDO 8-P synthase)